MGWDTLPQGRDRHRVRPAPGYEQPGTRFASVPERGYGVSMWWMAAANAAEPTPDVESARTAVFTDDPAVRAAQAAILVEAGALPGSAVAKLPSRAAVEQLLAPLRREHPIEGPWVCTLTEARAAEVVFTCAVDRCTGPCLHARLSAVVTGGAELRATSTRWSATDDGVCGCCMFVE